MGNTFSIGVSCRLLGASFQSATTDISAETAPIIEAVVAAGATQVISGIAFPVNTLNVLYMYSPTVDCTVRFVGNGGNTDIALTAGVPYLFAKNVTGSVDPLSDYPISGMQVTNLNTTAGVANAVNTTFSARLGYAG